MSFGLRVWDENEVFTANERTLLAVWEFKNVQS